MSRSGGESGPSLAIEALFPLAIEVRDALFRWASGLDVAGESAAGTFEEWHCEVRAALERSACEGVWTARDVVDRVVRYLHEGDRGEWLALQARLSRAAVSEVAR